MTDLSTRAQRVRSTVAEHDRGRFPLALRLEVVDTINDLLEALAASETALREARQELEQRLASAEQLLALGLKIDDWDPPLVNWLETPEQAMRAMTLNMAKSRDAFKHRNRKLEAELAALEARLTAVTRERDELLKEKDLGLPGTTGQGNPLEPTPRR